MMIDITKASVYVCSDTKYSSKDYVGGWIELINCRNIHEFHQECKKLHPCEECRFIFFDWENIPDCFINEKWISETIFYLIRKVSLLSNIDTQAFSIWADQYNYNFSSKIIENVIEYFAYHYEGKFKSKEAFARKYAQEYLGITARNYPAFDFKSYANNLFSWNFWIKNGFVFKK